MSAYRTRLTSSRPAEYERELPPPPDYEENWDLDACMELMFAVLETAIRDHRYLDGLDTDGELPASERKKVRAITEDNHPEAFFFTSWFEDICHLLRLDPDAVREVAGVAEGEQLRKAC